jgi:hypothetical protein
LLLVAVGALLLFIRAKEEEAVSKGADAT